MGDKQIILVENDVNLRQSIALILQRVGYLVTAIDNVNYALELVQDRHFHLLISDINIPETRSVLLPKIIEIYPDLPIVILTDQSSAEIERERNLFNAHYLIKPIAPERLLDSVGSILISINNNSNHYSEADLPTNHT